MRFILNGYGVWFLTCRIFEPDRPSCDPESDLNKQLEKPLLPVHRHQRRVRSVGVYHISRCAPFRSNPVKH